MGLITTRSELTAGVVTGLVFHAFAAGLLLAGLWLRGSLSF